RNEGTPVALIEAMAAGRPVVATRVGGVPDLVEDEATGLLTAPGDTAALAHALLRLAGDAPLRRRLGEAGRRRVAAAYSPKRLVADLERLYIDALEEKRGIANGRRRQSPADSA